MTSAKLNALERQANVFADDPENERDYGPARTTLALIATIRDLASALEATDCERRGGIHCDTIAWDTSQPKCARCAALDRCKETWG